MQKVLVYNPTQTPAIYGDGQSLGGMEWLEVPIRYVDELLADGCILVPEEGEPPVSLDASLPDDGLPVSDEVPSVLDDTVAEDSDDPVIADEPDTISKPRRTRKSSSEKE